MAAGLGQNGSYIRILSEKPYVSASDFVDYLDCVHRVVVSEVTSFLNVSSPQTGALAKGRSETFVPYGAVSLSKECGNASSI